MTANPSRRAVCTGLVGLAVSGLAGCGLPAGGPPQRGLDVGPPLLPPVRFRFEAPPPGASPEQIVRGFLAASWSDDDDYAAARAYLVGAAAEGWNPRDEVTVYGRSEDLRLARLSADVVEVRARPEARLDSTGRYWSVADGGSRRAAVTLAQVAGEWRISELPSLFGLWLSRFYFERAYRAFRIAYGAGASRRLTYDRRWFPVGAGLTTSLARALVEQPPPYLANAVVSGFPAGAQLSYDAVPVRAGTAQVDLTMPGGAMTADERRLAWAQALVTMRQAPSVTGVDLQVKGAPLEVAGTQGAPSSVEGLGYDVEPGGVTHAVRRWGTQLTAVDVRDIGSSSERRRHPVVPLPDVPLQWGRVAVSDALDSVVAVGSDSASVRWWRGGRSGTLPRFASRLGPPAIDVDGTAWLVGAGARGRTRVWVFTPGSHAAPGGDEVVAAPWSGGATITQVRPARDGARAAVVLARGRRSHVAVCGVVRDGDGMPAELTAPWEVGGDIVDVRRVAWVADDTLAVVGARRVGGPVRIHVVPIGGPTEELAPVAGPVAVASAGGPRGIVVATGSGRLMARAGVVWVDVGSADDVFLPGV